MIELTKHTQKEINYNIDLIKAGDKITLVKSEAFGARSYILKVMEFGVANYAQYGDCAYITFKRPRRRTAERIFLIAQRGNFAVYKGEADIDLPDGMIHAENSMSSKYGSFDARYWEEAVEALRRHSSPPLIFA